MYTIIIDNLTKQYSIMYLKNSIINLLNINFPCIKREEI